MKRLIAALVTALCLTACHQDVAWVNVYISSSCGSCTALRSVVMDLSDEADNLYVKVYDIDTDRGFEAYKALKERWDIDEDKVPAVEAEDTFLKTGYNAEDKDLLEANLTAYAQGQPVRADDTYQVKGG